MRRALLISFEPAHFVELRRVAKLLKDSGVWEPVLYFAKSYADTPAKIETCKAEGWEVRVEATPMETPESGDSAPAPRSWRYQVQAALRPLPEPVKEPLRRLRRQLRRYPVYKSILRAAAERARSVLREERVSLLVLPEDNLEHLTPVFVLEASRLGIASAIVPFTVANALEPAQAYIGNPSYTLGPVGSLIMRAYPQWVVVHQAARLVRIPIVEALAMQHMGYAPPQPWILNSGHASAIAVESEAMLAHYRTCKLPEAQLVLTGALYDDELAAAARAAPALRGELGLDARPILLCALPPDDGIPFRRPGQCEFATHDELARAWVTALCAQREFQVLVSLHPRTSRESMSYLEGLGARIPPTNVARLIPLCDVYVASGSATVRMAIACGKPVINYDVYRYRYTDYDGVPGVVPVDSRPAFEDAIRMLTSDPAALAAATARQRSIMERWGRLDGKAGERMLSLFDRLVTERSASGALGAR